MYKTEEEFLKHYDSSIYEKLSMTADILILSVSSENTGNYRKLTEKKFSVLLTKRTDFPFKDKWCLPGGFIGMDEDLETAAKRILKKETNLENIYIEQLYTFSDPKRDPRMRIVSTSYMSLIDKNKLNVALAPNTSWFNITILEDKQSVHITLDNGIEHFTIIIKKILRDKSTDRYDFLTYKNDYLAFDHDRVLLSGIERLKNKIEYTDIVFNMMPKYFTLGELQQVYEVILGKKLLAPAFRRIIAGKVVKTNKMQTGGGHRPSALFEYKKSKCCLL